MTSIESSRGGPASEEFSDFAEAVRDIDVDRAIRVGLRQTALDYRDALTGRIKRLSTSKGGTFDSRTSPYSPGTSNDSSDDSFHISEENAWAIRMVGEGEFAVYPRPAVRDRVRFLNYGTERHGPDGDVPMHFQVGNNKIVVIDGYDEAGIREAGQFNRFIDATALAEGVGTADERDILDLKFEFGEPGKVSGVDAYHFIGKTAEEIRTNNRLNENLRDALETEKREAFEKHGIRV